jgi:hypothetical protein
MSTFGLCPNWRDFMKVVSTEGPAECIKRIREAELLDYSDKEHPRTKFSDDASIITWASALLNHSPIPWRTNGIRKRLKPPSFVLIRVKDLTLKTRNTGRHPGDVARSFSAARYKVVVIGSQFSAISSSPGFGLLGNLMSCA